MAATLADGKSTKLVTSWKNPEYSGQAFHRILVLGMSAKPGVRADFEDALSKLVTREGVEAIPGNTILLRPEGTKLDIDYLKSQVKTFKIDAVIVSRLVKVDKTITYVPGQPYMPYPYYGSFYGYYGAVYPMVYTPDYLREDTTVRVETNVYAVTSGEGQLVWTGVSDTFNPQARPTRSSPRFEANRARAAKRVDRLIGGWRGQHSRGCPMQAIGWLAWRYLCAALPILKFGILLNK